MGDKVLMSYSRLSALITELTKTIDEFRSAKDRAGDLNSSLSSPFGHRELTEAASDSESRWHTKRKNLADDLERVRDRAQEIYDSFQQFDEGAGNQFESEQTA